MGAALGYAIEWDGRTVTLPAVGDSDAEGVPVTSSTTPTFGWLSLRSQCSTRPPNIRHGSRSRVVLIPRPTEYDQDAVSVAGTCRWGDHKDARHLGFLYRRFIDRLGDNTIPRLAELSDGEIHCTAIIERDDDCCDYLDFDDPDDLKYAFVDINLDLPRGGQLASAIEDFFHRQRRASR